MSIRKKQYDEYVWELKYRQGEIDDMALPPKLEKFFTDIITSKKCSNMLFSGPAGTGKTTIAGILSEKLDCNTMYINFSDETSIDIVRGRVKTFCASMSNNGNKKMIIGDEFERLSTQGQDALKALIEEFSKNVIFIFISNNKNMIIEPLHSRLDTIDFSYMVSKEDKTHMMKKFIMYCLKILKEENVKYDQKAVIAHVKQYFPDMRKCVNRMQGLSKSGDITMESVVSVFNAAVDDFFDALKEKDYSKICKLVAELGSNSASFYIPIEENIRFHVQPSDIPSATLIVAKWMCESKGVIDPSIALKGCCIELMSDVEYK